MAILAKRFQAKGACTHQSQQLLLLYENKKLEFLSSLVGPKALTVSFSNKLLAEQGKWGSRYTVLISLEK